MSSVLSPLVKWLIIWLGELKTDQNGRLQFSVNILTEPWINLRGKRFIQSACSLRAVTLTRTDGVKDKRLPVGDVRGNSALSQHLNAFFLLFLRVSLRLGSSFSPGCVPHPACQRHRVYQRGAERHRVLVQVTGQEIFCSVWLNYLFQIFTKSAINFYASGNILLMNTLLKLMYQIKREKTLGKEN